MDLKLRGRNSCGVWLVLDIMYDYHKAEGRKVLEHQMFKNYMSLWVSKIIWNMFVSTSAWKGEGAEGPGAQNNKTPNIAYKEILTGLQL